MWTITCILFIEYDIRYDIWYLVPYRNISSGIQYPVYNFIDRYIADIRYSKHWCFGDSIKGKVTFVVYVDDIIITGDDARGIAHENATCKSIFR